MTEDISTFGTTVLPMIRVRVGQDPSRPHMGRLSIGNWSVPCATGRGGLIDARRVTRRLEALKLALADVPR